MFPLDRIGSAAGRAVQPWQVPPVPLTLCKVIRKMSRMVRDRMLPLVMGLPIELVADSDGVRETRQGNALKQKNRQTDG